MSTQPDPIIPGLIERATNSTAKEVDPRLLRSIKSAARSSDLEVRVAAQTLVAHLRRPHSQVRYLSLLIADELFSRSALFRRLLVPDLDLLLTLTVGFRRHLPLPPPSSVAAALRSKSLEILERWNERFGVHYRQLRLGFDYLKNTLRLQFPNRQQERRQREERSVRSQQILSTKFNDLKVNFSSIKMEIQSTIDEIEQCLEIIEVKDEESCDLVGGGEELEFNSLELMRIRMDSMREGEKVRENSENRAVFDAIRELYKLLVTKHLAAVQDWISVLVRVEARDNRFRDLALKEFIDLRNAVRGVKKRCDDLGCVLDVRVVSREDEEEEDLWEEGKIEACAMSSDVPPSASKGKEKDVDVGSSSDKSSKACSSLTPLRSKLIAEAPVVEWSLALDDWGSQRDALANHRGLELDNHWGRVDPDAVIPAEKIAELKLHCTVYREESTEIRPCLAPLRKGGLCQRRDLRVCPFHGLIVSRDGEGNPIEQKRESPGEAERHDSVDADTSFDTEHVTVEKLARQAVKNVRERDRDVVDSLKRAKRAKVREHNDAVLREAAIASTSYSEAFGADPEASAQYGSVAKAKMPKEPTLASMLKKKVTPKDRIARRLLNTRVRDASSRQVMQGEDSKYREAFPNQW